MAYDNTKEALRTFGGLFVSRSSQGLKDGNSEASGKLDSSIQFRPTRSSRAIGIDVSMEDYAKFVDEGRKAGRRPPTAPIEKWLTYQNVKSKLSLGELTDSARKGIAYQIAAKIGREGTKGNHFLTNVVKSTLVTRDLPLMIENSISDDIEAMLDEVFAKFN